MQVQPLRSRRLRQHHECIPASCLVAVGRFSTAPRLLLAAQGYKYGALDDRIRS